MKPAPRETVHRAAAAAVATAAAVAAIAGKVGGFLPKEEAIEVMGKVVEKFKAGMFAIELDAGKTVLATMAGRLRRNRIKVMNGDRVSLELSPYDLTRGRITYRHKGAAKRSRIATRTGLLRSAAGNDCYSCTPSSFGSKAFAL